MADRSISAGLLAAFSSKKLNPILFYEATWASGVSRFWSGTGSIDWNGQTWIGAGNVINISAIGEESDVRSVGFSLSLTGESSALLALNLGQARRGLPGKVWVGAVEPDYVDFDFTKSTLLAKVGSGVATITFTRAGASSTRINSSGLLEVVAADTARFDYDVSTLASRGELIEDTRTNYFKQTTGWTANAGCTKTSNSRVGPYGTTTMDKLDFAAVLNANATQDTAAVIANGQVWTFSTWIYAAAPTTINFQFLSTPSNTQWSNEQTITIPAGLTRLSATAPAVSGITTDTGLRIYLVTRDSVARTIYVESGQMEQGTFATSDIPTTTVAVGRPIDLGRLASLGSWFSTTEFTVVAEFDAKTTVASAYSALFEFNDGTVNNRMRGLMYANGTLNLFTQNAGVVGANYNTANVGALDGTTVNRAALAFKNGSFAMSLNGGAVATSAAAAVLPTVTKMYFGTAEGGGGLPLNGHLRRLLIVPKRLSDTDLQSLSASPGAELSWGSTRVIADPFLAFSGRFDVPDIIDEGQIATIVAKYESRLVDLDRSRERRYTHEDQQLRLAGDDGFKFVTDLQNMTITWGTGQ
jgi:hypothetical protein